MDMMGNMFAAMNINGNNIIDMPVVDDTVVNIKTATPYNIQIINHDPDNGKYGKAIVTFLARKDTGTDKDQLITFSIGYQLTKENEDFICDLDCVEDDEIEFIGRRILNKSLINYLDSYIIFDLTFTSEDKFDKDEDPHFLVDVVEANTKQNKQLRMTADIASCVMFIDSYIKDMIENEHDFMLATTAGSKVSQSPAKIFVVDSVESIVEMAGAVIDDVYEGKNPFKKIVNKIKKPKRVYSTTVGLVLKVSRFVDGNKETDFILSPFDVGAEFDNEKFRGKTIEDIQGKYFGDADQYVSTLMIPEAHIKGVDKSYMVIRGKNKSSELKLYLFDHSAQEAIKHLIDTY